MTKTLTMRRLGLALLLITIAVGPFFHGYFFEAPTLVATGIVSLAFMAWIYGCRTERITTPLVDGWSERTLLALAAWIFLTAPWSIYARGTIGLLLNAVSAYLVYLMVRLESSAVTRVWIVRVLAGVAFVVAVIGLLEYSGFFLQFPAVGDLLRVEPQRSRIYTLFQYPNTAAAFFVASIVACNAGLVQSNSKAERLALAAVSGVVPVAFLFTLSRGGILIAPVAMLLLWAGLTRRNVGLSLLHLICAVVLPTGAAFYPILRAAQADNWPVVVLWTALAGGIGAGATWTADHVMRLGRRVRSAVATVLIAVLTIGGVATAKALEGELPRVWNRITQLSTSDLSGNARIEYLKDAVKLALRRPWGYGGGGWVRAYPQVQTVHYVARDPHSHYALLLVEAGIPGLLLTLSAIAVTTFSAFRDRREDPIRWAMAAAAVTLSLHAAIDVDFSYYMMWLLLWTLLGAAQPDRKAQYSQQAWRYTFPASLGVGVAVLLISAALASAAGFHRAAETAAREGDHNAALRAAAWAIRLDPLNSLYRTMIPTPANIQRALRLDPYNEELWRFVSILMEDEGDTASALAAAKRSLALRPMAVTHYERVAALLAEAMAAALEDGNQALAASYAEELIALGQEVTRRGGATLERQGKTFYKYPALTWTSQLNLAIGQAYYVIGNDDAALEKLAAALDDEQTASSAALWLHALFSHRGDQEALQNLRPWPSEQSLNSPLYAALTARRGSAP